MRLVIIPLVYIWVNIDTRGHTKSLKSQKIAVGPPGILPGSDTPGHKGLKSEMFEGELTNEQLARHNFYIKY